MNEFAHWVHLASLRPSQGCLWISRGGSKDSMLCSADSFGVRPERHAAPATGKRMVDSPESRSGHGGAAAALSLKRAPVVCVGRVPLDAPVGDAWLDVRGRACHREPGHLAGREARPPGPSLHAARLRRIPSRVSAGCWHGEGASAMRTLGPTRWAPAKGACLSAHACWQTRGPPSNGRARARRRSARSWRRCRRRPARRRPPHRRARRAARPALRTAARARARARCCRCARTRAAPARRRPGAGWRSRARVGARALSQLMKALLVPRPCRASCSVRMPSGRVSLAGPAGRSHGVRDAHAYAVRCR